MIVLLPEGRAVCNPDSIKMVKVVHSEVQGKRTFVVIVKLDDDSELMIKTLSSVEEAYALADQCSDLINSAEGGDDFSDEDEDDSDEDDDSFNLGLSASEEQAVKGTPSAIESDWDSESALTQAAPEGADSKAKKTDQSESSDWDLSSDVEESSSWAFTSEEEEKSSLPQEESSDWGDSPAEAQEESSDWGDSSPEPTASSNKSSNQSTGGSGGGTTSGGKAPSTAKAPVEPDESSDWSLSVDVDEEDDESSDWYSDDGFSAPVRSPVAKERAMKKKPKPVESKIPVVEVRRPSQPVVHEDSLDDSDDWFVDDGNDDWY
ncbi:MAG: hypothetical protein CL916_07480 [Deltaproteobacteria bacterium]|nr:hypothetical protein [Deltaproteobacteria bacterium]